LELLPSSVLAGSTPRRCPDIGKLARLGYRPEVPLQDGLPPTVRWYWENSHLATARQTEPSPTA
jgi:UDP-glucose 4-epimerase